MTARQLAAAALAATSLTAAGTAAAASKPDLRLSTVSKPPASLKAGASFNEQVRVENKGSVDRGGQLTMTLQGGPAPYNVPKRIGRITVAKLEKDLFRRYRIRLTIPFNAKAGSYVLRTCLKAQGRQQCKSSPRFKVTTG